MPTHKILEFYSGIGGMHYAALLANWDAQVLKAFDINTTANEIYAYNFGKRTVTQRNIEALSLDFYDKLEANIWTMSPPCQPYTRTGLKNGSKDVRAKSFLYLMDMLPKMKHPPSYILVENVKGFEDSDTRNLLVEALITSNYTFQEFLLTPLQLGIPNSRLRYYLLAKRRPLCFAIAPTTTLLGYVPFSERLNREFVDKRGQLVKDETEMEGLVVEDLRGYLENGEEVNVEEFLVPENILIKYGRAFDIVKPSSKRSCCFTKGG
ncbi:hypothetical protein BC937DRAFT_90955 [Endogone sp. FLAS-F59071]|nr:hypothetical protein BC937DRAFT_90955 [Endogone sp. FLAS-F59071]|eukprot:RUS16658.1 hypothetical protein BC937DRAFT_90955 [Endogone sp. FLAS-F59071]